MKRCFSPASQKCNSGRVTAKDQLAKVFFNSREQLMKDRDEAVERVRQALREVDSAVTDQEGECLYYLTRNTRGEGVIVEIGSWKGGSTIWLAKGSEASRRARIYAIDPHKGTAESSPYGETDTESVFRQNIEKAGVDHLITPIVMKSEEAIKGWTQPIGLLWIDGSHEYKDVLNDVILYEPWLQLGGIIAFHDAWDLGPRRVIRRYILKSNLFSNVGSTYRIIFASKKQSTFRDKRIKLRLLLMSYAAEVADFLTKPKGLRKIRPIIYKIGGAIKNTAGKS